MEPRTEELPYDFDFIADWLALIDRAEGVAVDFETVQALREHGYSNEDDAPFPDVTEWDWADWLAEGEVQTLRTQLEHCEDSLARQEQYMRDTLTKIADLVREAIPSEWEAIGTPNGSWTRQCLQEVMAIVDPPQEDGPTAEDLS